MLNVSKRKHNGFVASTDFIFLCTCILCIAVITWGAVGAKVVAEWGDLGSAVGSLDQSFGISGTAVFHAEDPVHNANNPIASWAGSSFSDSQDFCDENESCGIHIPQGCCPVGQQTTPCDPSLSEGCSSSPPRPGPFPGVAVCCPFGATAACRCGENQDFPIFAQCIQV